MIQSFKKMGYPISVYSDDDSAFKSKVKEFFDGLNAVILKLIDLIMEFAPYGVFALLATLVVESPSIDLFIALGMYSLTLIIGLILMIQELTCI